MLADVNYDESKLHNLLRWGDRLLEIDGVDVRDASREDIVKRIKNAGNSVQLVVENMQEQNKRSDSR